MEEEKNPIIENTNTNDNSKKDNNTSTRYQWNTDNTNNLDFSIDSQSNDSQENYNEQNPTEDFESVNLDSETEELQFQFTNVNNINKTNKQQLKKKTNNNNTNNLNKKKSLDDEQVDNFIKNFDDSIDLDNPVYKVVKKLKKYNSGLFRNSIVLSLQFFIYIPITAFYALDILLKIPFMFINGLVTKLVSNCFNNKNKLTPKAYIPKKIRGAFNKINFGKQKRDISSANYLSLALGFLTLLPYFLLNCALRVLNFIAALSFATLGILAGIAIGACLKLMQIAFICKQMLPFFNQTTEKISFSENIYEVFQFTTIKSKHSLEANKVIEIPGFFAYFWEIIKSATYFSTDSANYKYILDQHSLLKKISLEKKPTAKIAFDNYQEVQWEVDKNNEILPATPSCQIEGALKSFAGSITELSAPNLFLPSGEVKKINNALSNPNNQANFLKITAQDKLKKK